MDNYEQLVKALRETATFTQTNGILSKRECALENLAYDAAAAIEELLAFAHYVADKVTRNDEDWEDYHEAFAEVACRKLVKLGIVSVEDDKYVYSAEVQDGK